MLIHTYNDNIIISCEFWSLHSLGPLQFPGNLAFLATLDFHQAQENPTQKNTIVVLLLPLFE